MDESFTEFLIGIAGDLKSDKDELVIIDEETSAEAAHLFCARVALAMAFDKRPTAFKFRAMMEDWDTQRVTREMY